MEVSQMKDEGKNATPTHLEIPKEVYARIKANLEHAGLALSNLGGMAPEVLQPRIALIRRIVTVCEGDLMACTQIVKEGPR
jgi:hypothetical protein